MNVPSLSTKIWLIIVALQSEMRELNKFYMQETDINGHYLAAIL